MNHRQIQPERLNETSVFSEETRVLFEDIREARVLLERFGAGEVLALAFLAHAILVPDWAWRWEGHPGNEPKYLRQAVALGLTYRNTRTIASPNRTLSASPTWLPTRRALRYFDQLEWDA